ncbi:chemotaxis protein CheR [Kineobactrum sediminis]|uniref:protein-glutamate O-methyltransferase n=1 Tax=Kineobactrum sediminis TaxID=1905677 RepID=A0A2N5Y254_9GAMM|nr:chemotaxis protein CheB [Kineobactrum sediminis]PLW82484.1 chemotaxis protein CheR [Kineobactrum sediminis]
MPSHSEKNDATAQASTEGKESEASPFPIVGIGASAGGLPAFEAFFSGFSDGAVPGMAFVVVQHLDPTHKSMLTELVGRYTNMQVLEVEDGMAVKVNSVHIMPPGRDMAINNGALQLFEPSAPRGQRLPIDFFLRSLAADQREWAVAIILSGTGCDGTQGLRAIKGEGGMAMAQSPNSCEFDGMPRSALATGLVDYELPPGKMPQELMAYAERAFDKLAITTAKAPGKAQASLKKVFGLLHTQTRHDFSQYKTSTIYRRIERRMAVQQFESIDRYAAYLKEHPAEVEALFGDLLIGVTNFFRDPAVFETLAAKVIPALFADKSSKAAIRVWVPGCSTGEEAYSLAMLLVEYMETLNTGRTLQVFATDIDPQAVATARTGLYPASITADVSSERLARFFRYDEENDGYRIKKDIRSLLIFSDQNVIRDPPFSKMDLISCRNLLIYMGAELQKKVIPLFHYALKPGGWLFLGTSEGVGEFETLFDVVDRKAKIYQRKRSSNGGELAAFGRFVPSIDSTEPSASAPPIEHSEPRSSFAPRGSLRETTEQALLQEIVAAGILVDKEGDILYLHGRTGLFLEPAPGEAGVNNIIKMARQGLRPALGPALHQAAKNRDRVISPDLRVKTNGHFTTVNLTVRPVTSGSGASREEPLFLVILQETQHPLPLGLAAEPVDSATTETPEAESGSASAKARIAALKHELRSKEEYLQSTIEELETSGEELKSSNEEMQSVNEELQSANEELETSKEELQSVNEELATVNTELQTKVTDLLRANNDMNNLLAGTGIGTVFVDHDLRILRYTPTASVIINLIPSDVGRPVAHLASNLVGYDSLVRDVQSVLDTLVSKEVEVQASDGHSYTMRILPYRTLDNVIEGAVITFLDITEINRARNALREANRELQRLAVVVHDARDAITVYDLTGKTLAWNPGAEKLYGWTEAEALVMNLRDRLPLGLRDEVLQTLDRLSRAETLEPYRTRRLTKSGEEVEVSVISTALFNDAGEMYAISTTERAMGSVP